MILAGTTRFCNRSELKERLIDVPWEGDREAPGRKLAFPGKEIDILVPGRITVVLALLFFEKFHCIFLQNHIL